VVGEAGFDPAIRESTVPVDAVWDSRLLLVSFRQFPRSYQSVRDGTRKDHEKDDRPEREECSLRHVYRPRSDSEEIKKFPRARIDGTHTPTKIPFRRSSTEASFWKKSHTLRTRLTAAASNVVARRIVEAFMRQTVAEVASPKWRCCRGEPSCRSNKSPMWSAASTPSS